MYGPSGAAAKLGIPRTTLESKIKSLKINKNRFKGQILEERRLARLGMILPTFTSEFLYGPRQLTRLVNFNSP